MGGAILYSLLIGYSPLTFGQRIHVTTDRL